MAKEIDYKVTNFNMNTLGVTAKVRIYRGEVTTLPEAKFDPVSGSAVEEPVTRYRRDLRLKEIDITLNPQEVERLLHKYINKRVTEEATRRGLTVISGQQSTNV